jgi:HD-like signal output (HDOD) protein
MTCEPPLPTARRADAIARDIDHARQHGSLRQIVVPPCPERLTRLQQALAVAEPDLAEVARIASSDVAMSATLIRNASGARFAAFSPAQTVGQAMNRLGLRETAALMTGFLARNALPVRSPQLQRFWERAGKRAIAMDFLARQLPGLSADLAYTYGLFCHVGQPVLLQSFKGYAGTLVEAQARRDRPFIATENANHRTDHAVVGALVARLWQLDPTIMCAVRLHHDLDTLGHRGVEPEVHTLVAAGLVAEQLMRRHEGLDAEREWTQHAPAAMAWLHVGSDEVETWEENLTPLLDDSI